MVQNAGNVCTPGEVRTHAVVSTDERGEEESYAVDKIKAHEEKEGMVWYLVKWKGYKKETWEEEKNFEEEEDPILCEYWKKKFINRK
jgi:hypothetical protein